MNFDYKFPRVLILLFVTLYLAQNPVLGSEIEEEALLSSPNSNKDYQSLVTFEIREGEEKGQSLASSRAASEESMDYSKPSVPPQARSGLLQDPVPMGRQGLALGDILNLHHSFKPVEEEPYNPYVINHVGLISATLKIVEIALLQKEPASGSSSQGAQESAEYSQTVLEEPGDIQNGLFILFESVRRPHRYHACFYTFDEAAYQAHNPVFLVEDNLRSQGTRSLFQTSADLSLNLRACLLTKTKPNKLYLSIEEVDTRCCGLGGGRVLDFFGMIYSKFENDPLAAVSLMAGGASRLAKAVVTNGASELANLTGN